MNEYLLVNSAAGITEYGVIVLSKCIIYDVNDEVMEYGISYTDNIEDATRFTCISTAFQMIKEICDSPDDWDVVPFMEEK